MTRHRLVKLRIASEKLVELINDLDQLPYGVHEYRDGQICVPVRLVYPTSAQELDVLLHPDSLAALAGRVSHDIVRRRYSADEKSPKQ